MNREALAAIRLLALASSLAVFACATSATSGENLQLPASTSPLEASGQVNLFVRVIGADGGAFQGESSDPIRRDFVPAIQFYSDLEKASAGGTTKCTKFQFTKAAGVTSPQFARVLASGETLKSVHMEFVKQGTNFVWQELDLTGIRVSMLEQGSTTPVDGVPSGLLEEVTLAPVGTANVTLTSIPQSETGGANAAIPVSFTCK